ncbi:MAG: hypothetical protein MUF42_08260 [Cytophagaceae bacterium]|nr:hypothetical protein [Cytophagaceae bacterium]
MKKIFFSGILILLSVFLVSCAESYTSISPSKVRYAALPVKDTSVVLQYCYEVLHDANNKKHARKEQKFNVNMVAIKITNNTDAVVKVSDLDFFCGDNKVNPLSPEMTKKVLRQKGEFHLFYLGLTPMTLYNGATNTATPIGFVIGPGLALLNMGMAHAANMNMLRNLKKYSIENKEIGPGTSLYGLIGIPGRRGDPLHIRLNRY